MKNTLFALLLSSTTVTQETVSEANISISSIEEIYKNNTGTNGKAFDINVFLYTISKTYILER